MANLMPRNEHNIERVIRVVLGVVLLGGLGLMAVPSVGLWGLLGLVGIVPLATGLLGTCPIYTLLGVSTCPMDAKNPS